MDLELEVSESEDYTEFLASETVEQKLCFNCKRKEEKGTRTLARKVYRKRRSSSREVTEK